MINHPSIQELKLSSYATDILKVLSVLSVELSGSRIVVCLMALWSRQGLIVKRRPKVVEIEPALAELIKHGLVTSERRQTRYQVASKIQGLMIRSLYQSKELSKVISATQKEVREDKLSYQSWFSGFDDDNRRQCTLQRDILNGRITFEKLANLRERLDPYDNRKQGLKKALSILTSAPYDEQWKASLNTEILALGLEMQPATQFVEDQGQLEALLYLNNLCALTPALVARLRRLSLMSGDDYNIDWTPLNVLNQTPDDLLVRSWADLMNNGITTTVIKRYHERLQQWRKLNRKRTALPNRLEVLWLTLAELTLADTKELKALLKPLTTYANHEGAHHGERQLLYRIVNWKLNLQSRPEINLNEDDPIELCFNLIALKWFDLKWNPLFLPKGLLKPLQKLCQSGLNRLAFETGNILLSMDLIPKRDLKEANKLMTALKAQFEPQQILGESYEPAPLWETQLLNITQICSSESGESSNKPSQATERLAWGLYIAHSDFEVECRHQIKKGNTWSKGRKVSLKRLMLEAETFSFLTTQDHEICAHIKQTVTGYGWNGTTTSYILTLSGLVPMIDHPYVFSARTWKRIKVERGIPSVEVKETKGKKGKSQTWNLNFIPQLTRSEPLIFELKGSRLFIFELTATQRALCTHAETIEIPTEGIPMLQGILSQLSQHFTIHSELPIIAKNSEKKANRSTNELADSTDIQLAHSDVSTITQNKDLVKLKKDLDSKLTIRLKRDGDQLIISRHLMIPESTLELTPGEGFPIVTARNEETEIIYHRDLEFERSQLNDLSGLLNKYAMQKDDHWLTEDIEQSFNLLLVLQERDEIIEWPKDDRLSLKALAQDQKLTFKFSSGSQRSWFKLEGSLSVDENTILDLAELLRKLRTHNSRYIRLTNDELITLTQEMSEQLRNLDALLLDDGDTKLKAHAALASQLSSVTQELSNGDVSSPTRWLQLATQSKEAHAKKRNKPRSLTADLRTYQRVGFEWLSALMDLSLGACLADDMGLGKTVQVIALLCQRRAAGASLVVAPTSLLSHWHSEIERFASDLTPIVFNDVNDRKATIQALRAKHGAKKVLITSYGLLVQSIELFTDLRWNIAIFDEAQALKNPETKRYQAAAQLKTKGRVALSGTPIENRLSELWSLFSLLIPGLLGDRAYFKTRFENPIEDEIGDSAQAKSALRALTHPFILRRLKSDVLSDLPAKTEQTLRLRPSKGEIALYEALRHEALRELDEARVDGNISHIEVLARLTRLRLAACHPELLRSHFAESPELSEHLDQLSISAKQQALIKILKELKEAGHRALIFSQFVSHLNLIKGWLDQEEISYQYLDGSTKAHLRTKRVTDFQSGHGDVFLISLKAGGVGLNLTAADYVIHMDPWWNPAVEDQATDRAHRIGQTKPVTVYRLITEGTVEEKILALHEQKRSLAKGLLEGSDTVKKIDLDTLIAML